MRVFIKLVVAHDADKSARPPSAVGLHLYVGGERACVHGGIWPRTAGCSRPFAFLSAHAHTRHFRGACSSPRTLLCLEGDWGIGGAGRVKYVVKAVPPQAGEEAYTPHIAWREYQLPEVSALSSGSLSSDL
eukprot:339791-Rhodomonas_salina.1